MKHNVLVYILGDLHGHFGQLNSFINNKIRLSKAVQELAIHCAENGEDLRILILQCGDFAFFWPHMNFKGFIKNNIDFLASGRVPIYWCAGNHEDWDKLDSLTAPDSDSARANIVEVDAGVYFCPFGSTLDITPDLVALFAGGAESNDKDYRLDKMKNLDFPKIWWEQEEITAKDMETLAAVPRADWIISHTAPAAFNLAPFLSWFSRHEKTHGPDPSREFLNIILERYRPNRWFFGHFHQFMQSETDGCKWECLNYLGGGSRSWEQIFLEYED